PRRRDGHGRAAGAAAGSGRDVDPGRLVAARPGLRAAGRPAAHDHPGGDPRLRVRQLMDGGLVVRAEPRVVPAEFDHVLAIGGALREADRAEVWASGRYLPVEAVLQGYRASTHVWTGLIGDEPICMFGVAPVSLLGAAGRPWMLGT